MMNCYIQFCVRFTLRPINPSVTTIVYYLEYLASKLTSPKSIQNYWAAVKLLHAISKSRLDNVDDIQVNLMLRSLPLTKRHISSQKLPITKQHLLKMCTLLQHQGTQGVVVKSAILIGFFAFLRCSNLCPDNDNSFDISRHFCRGDVEVTQQGLNITLKWTKSMQSSLLPKTIPVPVLSPSLIDPVQAFKDMCQAVKVE